MECEFGFGSWEEPLDFPGLCFHFSISISFVSLSCSRSPSIYLLSVDTHFCFDQLLISNRYSSSTISLLLSLNCPTISK